jgi:hypothetical protein
MANTKGVKEKEFNGIYNSYFGANRFRFFAGAVPNTILTIDKIAAPPRHLTNFRVDEQVVIKDYTYRVACVGEGYLVVEPMGPVIIGKDTE